MNHDDRLARLRRLSPTSRLLVVGLVTRSELSVADVARLQGLSVSNARTRLRREVYGPNGLDVEGRAHLVGEYRDAVAELAGQLSELATSM